ncbi:hypothetical protein [Flavobacterium gilvum]|uniref:Uncharacterized protein n=1 Tax=Flavobacterium gilvum TaxID=1492737 RepID=A0AAC9N5S0_9FLAO|nr:hypothetical protein [Flavobacterium gilvum]AOW08729.1 hypothetical protein EM308_04005 [Flavobacterium gilvum]KFC59832.1 hypothetical protein FEM08_13430 [Flavobacterium gilvum]
MKKLLLFIALIICFITQAQQTNVEVIMAGVNQREAERKAIQDEKDRKASIFDHPNKDFIISLEKLDQNAVRAFADQVANSGKTKWEFVKTIEDEKKGYCSVKYIDSSIPSDLKEKIIKGIESCDKCLYVDFGLYFEGENKDLEIKGIKKYRFRDVSGKYLDLFPTWQKTFRPDVQLEQTLNDYNNRELVHKAVGIRYKLEKQGEIWTLTNNSNLYDYFKVHP